MRWIEEENRVRAEMGWTVLGFNHLARKWDTLVGQSTTSGQKAYAEKQKALWAALRDHAKEAFGTIVISQKLPGL